MRRGANAAELAAAAALFGLSMLVAERAGATGGSGGASTAVFTPSPVAMPSSEPYRAPGPLGAHLDDDHAMPAHAQSVHDTKLSATLDDARHVIVGEEEIVWTNTSRAPVAEVYFHMYLNAFKNERTVFLRSRLGDGRGSSMPREWGYVDLKSLTLIDGERETDLKAQLDRHSPGDPEDETDLRAPLPSPIPPGGRVTFRLTFESKLPDVVERTGFVGGFYMVAQWFPKLARLRPDGTMNHFAFHRLSEFDADFGSYDVTIDVPAGYAVGATGAKSSESANGARKKLRFQQADVHDFAFTAWSDAAERRANISGVDVHMLYPKNRESVVDRTLESVRVGIVCYGARFGRYPYATLTIVHPPEGAAEAGGMEYPTLITTGEPWVPFDKLRVVEALTVHELGHQWFYGLVASDEHDAPFLDEGINSYAESRCLRELGGDGSAVDLAGVSVSVDALHRLGALAQGHDDAIARASAGFATSGHYGRLVYSRTATLLSSLGGAFGEQTVERALGRYARGHRFGHPDARHLLAAFDEVGGKQLADAARVGLYDRGWVDYAVGEIGTVPRRNPHGVFDRASGRETVTTTDKTGEHDAWAVVVRRGTLELPVDIELGFVDGTRRRTRWDGKGNWVRVTDTAASPLAWVVVDPDHKILIDERLDDNARSMSPRRVPWRALERLTTAGALAALVSLP